MRKIIFWLVIFLGQVEFVFSAPPKIAGRFSGISGRSLSQSTTTISDLLTDYYLALDWSFSPYPEVNGYARTSISRDTNLSLEESYLEFFPGKKISLKGFYRKKEILLKDPLKILEQPVSLKYEQVEFFDEFNEYKFRGANEQGLAISFRLSENTGLNIFYSDLLNPTTYYSAGEDNLALRLEKKFSGLPLKIGGNYVFLRGIHWPYAENNDWFPDPESTAGYSLDTSSRNSVSLWYKGYLEKEFFSVDGLFNFTENVGLWVESGGFLENLSTVLKSGNIGYEKKWEISRKDITACGLKSEFGKMKMELNYNNERESFSLPYANLDYPLKKNTFGLVGRYNFSDNDFIGFLVKKFQVDRKTGEGIPVYIHPLRQDYLNVLPYNIGGYFNLFIPETAGKIQFQLKKKSFQIGCRGAIETGKTIRFKDNLRVITSGEVFDDYQNGEGLVDFKLKLAGNFYWENSCRLVYYQIAAEEKTFFNNYTGISLRLSDFIFFRLGYGIDPDDWRDDIKLGFDRRVLFLYNLVSSGKDILSAEEELAREKQFTFRTEIKF